MKKRKAEFVVLPLLAITVFLSHFMYFESFGLYEDDYYNLPPYFDYSAGDMIESVKLNLTDWLQGRPLSFLPYIFSMTGFKIAGLPGLYLIALMINTVNAFLMYFILKKIIPDSGFFAATGALMFCLFPSDTTKTLLIHSFLYQMSVMFFLAAALMYLCNYKIVSYFTVMLCLFSFESMFILFFAVPFLSRVKKPGFWKSYAAHVLILSSFILLAFLYRKFSGETRIEDMTGNFIDYAVKSFVSMFWGPVINLYAMIRAPYSALRNSDVTGLVEFLFFSVFLFLTFYLYYKKFFTNGEVSNTVVESNVSHNESGIKSRANLKIYLNLMPAALLFVSLGYVLSFTHYPPNAIIGRLTSVHIPAAFGVSLMFGLITTVTFESISKSFYANVFLTFVSFYFSALIIYGIIIQKDFVQSWINQQKFWTKVVKLCPDFSNDMLIILDNKDRNLPSTNYILSNSWADPIMLQRMFGFPPEWNNPPRLFVLNNGFENRITLENDTLKWKVPEHTFFSYMENLKDSNLVMLFSDENKSLHRLKSETVNLKGKTLFLKPENQSHSGEIKKNILYNLLIKE